MRYFTIFCVFLAFALIIVFMGSCRNNNAEGLYEPEAQLVEANPGPEIKEGQDLILVSYLDPELRENVTAFFAEMAGSSDVAEAILSNAALYDIPPALAFSLCAEESAYNRQAINNNRNGTVDRGLFQLNSATFPKLSVADFYKPDVNARYGISHLRWCLNTAGTEVSGLAMYNAGHNRVRAGGTPKVTLDYVSRILRRQRGIEERFAAEYPRIAQIENAPPEIAVKREHAPFRLSLLTPLGAR